MSHELIIFFSVIANVSLGAACLSNSSEIKRMLSILECYKAQVRASDNEVNELRGKGQYKKVRF